MSHILYADKGVKVTEDYVEVSDGVALKVIDFLPECDGPERPAVVFVAGWISLISGWQDVLKQLIPRYRTIYIETREKVSARLPEGSADFSVARMSLDIHEILNQSVSLKRPFCFVGSSLGATVVLDYLSQNLRQPSHAILIGPNAEFSFPVWSLPLIRLLPAFLYAAVKPGLKWYLRNIRLDKHRESEQVKKYEGTIDAAEPRRFKANAWALRNYKLWDKLPEVKAPVLIIGARSDILHGMDIMKRMVALMPCATLEIMESNRETHSEKAGNLIVKQIALREYSSQGLEGD
jgi:pimeloyl-ACP methyl ester carboxylesterase